MSLQTVGGDGHIPTFGPVGPTRGPSLGYDLGYAHLRPKGRDYDLISVKLVKTAKCHHKIPKRPVIVPIFKNRLGKSPLGFLRFPYCQAFSHKELLGRI